ncbi:hypothetical protein HNR23_000970 [Nocardiopsis mwathae]|uniref:Uncharacterized protein n=1 Tax=Nocardiopsis mwathae TaxID=1472723 RepID=A0A7W9YFC0_9ACTN|nr:hypothetical protein [Nocardiopsis mwathae]MBB6170910.1 hypothetical protein [Nocardiopsis mwathae]
MIPRATGQDPHDAEADADDYCHARLHLCRPASAVAARPPPALLGTP